MPWAGFAGVDALRAMFPSLFSGPDALHHGRYGPEGHFLLLRSCSLSRSLPSLSLRRGRFPWSSLFGGPWWFRGCCSFWVVDVPGMQSCRFQFRSCSSSTWSSTPLSLRRVYPMVQTVRQTWDSKVASHGGRRPCSGVEQVHFPVVAQRQFPWSTLLDHRHSQLLNTVADVPVVRSHRSSSSLS